MKITTEVEVFDRNVLTKGSKIKVNGTTIHQNATYNDEIVTVVKCTQDVLTVKRKIKIYEIEFWEYLCNIVEIEMVKHVEPQPEPIPF